MGLLIVFHLLLVIVILKDFKNYELKQEKVYDFSNQLRSKTINDYFFPNDNTLIVKTQDSIELINIQ